MHKEETKMCWIWKKWKRTRNIGLQASNLKKEYRKEDEEFQEAEQKKEELMQKRKHAKESKECKKRKERQAENGRSHSKGGWNRKKRKKEQAEERGGRCYEGRRMGYEGEDCEEAREGREVQDTEIHGKKILEGEMGGEEERGESGQVVQEDGMPIGRRECGGG